MVFQDVAQNPANKVSEQPKDYESGGQVKFGGQVNALMIKFLLKKKYFRSPSGCHNNTKQYASDCLMKKAGVL